MLIDNISLKILGYNIQFKAMNRLEWRITILFCIVLFKSRIQLYEIFQLAILMTCSCRMNPTETNVRKWKDTKKIMIYQRGMRRHIWHIHLHLILFVGCSIYSLPRKKELYLIYTLWWSSLLPSDVVIQHNNIIVKTYYSEGRKLLDI